MRAQNSNLKVDMTMITFGRLTSGARIVATTASKNLLKTPSSMLVANKMAPLSAKESVLTKSTRDSNNIAVTDLRDDETMSHSKTKKRLGRFFRISTLTSCFTPQMVVRTSSAMPSLSMKPSASLKVAI